MTATAAARLCAAARDPHDSLERSGFATALFAGTLPFTRCTARITAALPAGPTQAEASPPAPTPVR
ncbi:hypothetical protein ABT187_11770 [Streptomyces sp. NPDC001817]|uniref:hypothetical protein n=1 Tax=Streptomyces sp. NPDC001817 TaxID=3154398 RepID=UPI00332E08E7